MADGTQANSKTVLQRIEDALNEVLTLKIKTLVMPLSGNGAAGDDWDVAPVGSSSAEGFITQIRLEQGDITNYMSPGALDNEAMLAFHNQQVAMSRQIVADNLKALHDLAVSISR
jgi:hypothetical protein